MAARHSPWVPSPLLSNKGYEIVPDHKNGVYPRTAGKAYGPEAPLKTFDLPTLEINEGVLQRLPNGNTFVCNARTGTGSAKSPALEEYDSNWKSVWQLNNVTAYVCFRYDSAYMGSTVLETDNNNGIEKRLSPKIPATSRMHFRDENGKVRISFGNNAAQSAIVSVYSPCGRTVLRKTLSGSELLWDYRNNSLGIYLIKAILNGKTMTSRFSLLR